MEQSKVSEIERKFFFVFPGQGSQYRGMGSDLVSEFESAREIFERSSEVVGYDMAARCFEDPDGQLNLTRFTQPALVTHQLACLAALQNLLGDTAAKPVLTAGHSLGEYSALVVAGALTVENAITLVKRRGELMGELGEGSMLATTLDLETAASLADKYYCGIGGCNLPEQTVIAGPDADLEALSAEMADAYPRKRAIPLKTEGAFHTYLMVEAARRFREVLDEVEFSALEIDVLSNYTGTLHDANPRAIRSRLFFQLFNPVRWFACIQTAFEQDINCIVEFGGGIGSGETPAEKRPNLEGMIKKALKLSAYQADYFPAINVAGIYAIADTLAE
jgi:[acyl-carrier-protein] S-malonyltransferase